MRRLTYRMLPAMGPGEGPPVQGTPADLARAIPYLLAFGLVPPLPVLNDVFRKGVADAGMSGGARWEPFELPAAEYDEVAASLAGLGLRRATSPDWVQTRDDWTIWALEHVRGVPAAEHRRLAAEEAAAERAYRQAAERGDPAALDRYVRRLQMGQRLSEFLMRYLGPRRDAGA